MRNDHHSKSVHLRPSTEPLMAAPDRATNDFLLAILRCAGCKDGMRPPILRCSDGHSFCGGCFRRMRACLLCNAPKTRDRNVHLERAYAKAVVPCANPGCGFEATPSVLLSHEGQCGYRYTGCPLASLDGCDWTGRRCDMVNHCAREHPRNTFRSARQTLVLKGVGGFATDAVVKCETVMAAHGCIFKGAFLMDCRRKFTSWCVFNLDGEESGFKFEVEFADSTGRTTALQGPCAPYYGRTLFREEYCVLTHHDLLERCCVDGDLFYSITVVDCRLT